MNKLIPMEHYRELVWQRAINSLLLQVLKESHPDGPELIARAEGREP